MWNASNDSNNARPQRLECYLSTGSWLTSRVTLKKRKLPAGGAGLEIWSWETYSELCGIYLGNVNLYVVRSQEVAWAIFVAGLQDALLSQQVLWLHINRLDDHGRACLQEQATALDLACCLKDPTQACPNPSSSPDSDTYIDWHVYFPIIFHTFTFNKKVVELIHKTSTKHIQRSRRPKPTGPRRLNFNSQAAAKAKPKASAKAKAAAPTAGEPDGNLRGEEIWGGQIKRLGSYQIGKIEKGNSFFGKLVFFWGSMLIFQGV